MEQSVNADRITGKVRAFAGEDTSKSVLEKRIRALLVFFMLALVLSGLSATPALHRT
jgi:hypothetical protein